MEIFQPWHLIVVAIIAVVFFGGKRLPELGKGLGEGFKGFKDGLKGVSDEPPTAPPAAKTGDTAHTVTPKAEEAVK